MTAKKKTLIELMLDAGVKPEDINGDFIVCDKTCTDEPGTDEPCVRPFCKLDAVDLSAGFRERAMNKGVTNIAEDKQVEDIDPCKVVDNSAYDCESTDDTGISLSFEEADKRADNYTSLSNVLRRAYDQASSGKGQERHGQDLPFTKQPMQLIQDLCGEGFALGQAMKKMQESQRLPHDAAIRELLGAINYIAGAIIHKEKLQGSK